jgi:arylsulfatase A-like enzyme
MTHMIDTVHVILARRVVVFQFAVSLLAFTTAAGMTPAIAAEPQSAGKRPNIVLVIGDDHGWTDFGFMGNARVRTPNIDRLAAEGHTFTRGYVTTALCSPSLATLLTGLHPHQHGITGNDPVGSEKREAWLERFFKYPLLPRLLADAGYLTMHTGKYWMRKPADAGFTDDMGDTDRHGGKALAIGRETMQPIYDAFDKAKKQDKPFFIWYAPFLPHTPHTPPARLLEKYKQLEPEQAKYYAMVEWLDETCGGIMKQLDDRGLTNDTLLVFINDNGWNDFGKRTPYENGVRTPIILRWPGRIPPRLDKEHLAGNVDIFPTLLAAAGVPVPQGLPGVNLLDDAAIADRSTLFLANYAHDMLSPTEPEKSLSTRTCIDGNWKLIHWQDHQPPHALPNNTRVEQWHKNPGVRNELFDLTADPQETKNLAAEHPERVRELLAKVNAWWNPADAPVEIPQLSRRRATAAP